METQKIKRIQRRTNDSEENKRSSMSIYMRLLVMFVLLIMVLGGAYFIYSNTEVPAVENIIYNFIDDRKMQKISTIAFDTNMQYQFQTYKNNIILCNKDGIKAINKKGADEWSIAMTLFNPFICTNDKYILVAARGGREVNVITNYSRIATITTGEPIITAKINENGYFTVVTEQKGYKGKVTVYNPRGEELYKWHSVQNRITDVDISNDGKRMAISILDTSKGKVSGGLMFFYLDQVVPYAATVVEDTLISHIKFYSDYSLAAIGDNQTIFFTPEGTQKSNVSYMGRILQGFNTRSDEFVVLALSERKGGGFLNNKTIVEILNRQSQENFTYKADGEISNLDIQDDTIVFNYKRNIYAINEKGVEMAKVTVNKDVKDLSLFQNKRQILVVSTNQLDIVDY